MKLLTLVLVAAVLLGVLGAMAAEARAQEEGDIDGPQEREGPPTRPPLLPDELLPDEDRALTENEEAPQGASTQPEAPEASLSMPFATKISIVIVVFIVALIVIVLRKTTVPAS